MDLSLKSQIIVADFLSPFDIGLILFFVATYLVMPKMLARRSKPNNEQEYLLMGCGLSLPMFIATLVATWYGGIFGVTQIAFENGVYSFFTQGLFWYVSYFLFAFFLAKKIRRHQVLSLPELIGQKFGERARKLSAIILFFHALPVTYAISVGLFLQLALGLDFLLSLVLGVVIVAIYTSMGGFRGVVVTDCLQFVLMFTAVLMVTGVLMYRFGTTDFLLQHLPPHFFSWRGDGRVSSAVIWLFVASTSTLIHPVFYQRCLAAKSDRVAIVGILIAMLLWMVFDTCTTLGGMYARALIPEADSAQAYLLLGLQILPSGLRGIFISGILATILSTLDSFMFVSGTSLSYDFFGRNARSVLRSHKLAILFCAIFVAGVAAVFGTDFESVWLFREGSFSTALFVPVLATLISRRSFNDKVFIWTATSAMATFALCTSIHEPNAFYAAHGAALVSFIAASYFYAHREAKLT